MPRMLETLSGQRQVRRPEGPCPNCKTVIQIPRKEDEVVIHGGEDFDFAGRTRGRAIGKPILREQTVVKPGRVAAVAAGVIVVFASAGILGRSGLFRDSLVMCGLGLLIVSPALTIGGYKFLYHSEELLLLPGQAALAAQPSAQSFT